MVPSDRCLDAVLSAAAAAIRCHEEYPDNQNVGAASGVLAAVGILQRMWREGRKPSGAAVLALLRALEGTPIIHHPRCNAAAASATMCHSSTSVEVASSERRSVLELVGNWVCRPQAPIAAGAASPGLRWDGGTAQARRRQQQEVEATCERLWDPL